MISIILIHHSGLVAAHGGIAGLELFDNQRGPLLCLVGEVGILVVICGRKHILADIEALASLTSTQQ